MARLRRKFRSRRWFGSKRRRRNGRRGFDKNAFGRGRADNSHVALWEGKADTARAERLQNCAIERAFQVELTLFRIRDPHAQLEHDTVVAEAREKRRRRI